MNVGIADTPCAAAVSLHLSTSIFRNTAFAYLADNCWNIGPILWQGPHLQKLSINKKLLAKNCFRLLTN